mmetsp:Transcript_96754/g.279313  ORF Transcript_96754/g.279313 Transcript_96754/m.279313 type:complete len:231 (-) Transcript_96754:292-984(-)
MPAGQHQYLRSIRGGPILQAYAATVAVSLAARDLRQGVNEARRQDLHLAMFEDPPADNHVQGATLPQHRQHVLAVSPIHKDNLVAGVHLLAGVLVVPASNAALLEHLVHPHTSLGEGDVRSQGLLAGPVDGHCNPSALRAGATAARMCSASAGLLSLATASGRAPARNNHIDDASTPQRAEHAAGILCLPIHGNDPIAVPNPRLLWLTLVPSFHESALRDLGDHQRSALQ